MKAEFTIKGRLEGLNEYTRACRSHWSKGKKMKAEQQEIVFWSIKAARLKPVSSPVTVSITWFETNRRRDFDNITFAAKFIMDTLVGMRILPDDSQKWIYQIINKVKVDKQNPRIEVSLEEIKHKECNQ